MEIKVVPRPLCLVCGSHGIPLHEALQDHLFHVPGSWRMTRCGNSECGMAWLDPSPALSDLPQLYRSYYTHAPGPSAQSTVPWIRSLLYRIYLGGSSIPSSLLGIKQERARLSHMFLDKEKPGRILDVGCGSGSFLHRMAQLGWQGVGTDFDSEAIECAKTLYEDKGFNLRFQTGDLSEAGLRADEFDAVTMNHVIEHVPDPIALLSEIRRLLKLKGKMVAATPNIRSYGHMRFQANWRGLEPPRHLQVFSPSALNECARRAGFTRHEVITSASNADSIVGASFGISDLVNKGRRYGGVTQVNFIRGVRSLLLQYREAWMLRSNPDVGEELVLICEK